MSKGLLLKALYRLGPENLLRVLLYKAGIKTRLNPLFRLQAAVPQGSFFRDGARPQPPASRRVDWLSHRSQFGLLGAALDGAPPNWHRSCINGASVAERGPWFAIPDFDPRLGDIKGVWEASRFDWLVALAQAAVAGEAGRLRQLNHWLSDWFQHNPPYTGANWKCGQEASIRVLHMALAATLLGQQDKPEAALLDAVALHLKRIAPTLMYAVAQDNNHGTSEAAALFVGGSWLQAQGRPEGKKFYRLGRKWLEDRAARLIMAKGSFSQYSVNYHRVMLDSYCWVEYWRRALALPVFSPTLYQQLQKATAWLGNMVMGGDGDTPNLGANDGARLIQLCNTDYRDVRPSVQLATQLFYKASAYVEPGEYDAAAQWLALPRPAKVLDHRKSCHYDDAGFMVLRRSRAALLFRYPRFRFRPSQSDLMHVDFWLDGQNILRDDGSYSYNSGDQFEHYFGDAAAHNTVKFDDSPQMPKLSRFLYGAWPRAKDVAMSEGDSAVACSAAYRDWRGHRHRRAIRLTSSTLRVSDQLGDFQHGAVLRWRLMPGDWRWQDGKLVHNGIVIQVQHQAAIRDIRLVSGWESRYYSQKTALPVLEVAISEPCEIITEISF